MLIFSMFVLALVVLLYLICGFIIWGYAIQEYKESERKDIERLGLSIQSFTYKPLIRNIWSKILLFIFTLLAGPSIMIHDIIKGDFDMSDFHIKKVFYMVKMKLLNKRYLSKMI